MSSCDVVTSAAAAAWCCCLWMVPLFLQGWSKQVKNKRLSHGKPLVQSLLLGVIFVHNLHVLGHAERLLYPLPCSCFDRKPMAFACQDCLLSRLRVQCEKCSALLLEKSFQSLPLGLVLGDCSHVNLGIRHAADLGFVAGGFFSRGLGMTRQSLQATTSVFAKFIGKKHRDPHRRWLESQHEPINERNLVSGCLPIRNVALMGLLLLTVSEDGNLQL